MNAYFTMWRQGLTFTGRTRRKNFWLAVLINYLIVLVLSFGAGHSQPVDLLINIYSLLFIVPQTAITFRRLHDSGHSGAWFLLLFLPIVGWLVLLYFLLQPGTFGENPYGADPKAFERDF